MMSLANYDTSCSVVIPVLVMSLYQVQISELTQSSGPAQPPRPHRLWTDHYLFFAPFFSAHAQLRCGHVRTKGSIMALSKQAVVKYPDISAKPHQPVHFAFPNKRDYGKQVVVRRSCQSAWFERWPWLHYREDDDCVFCHTCVKELKMPTRNIDCEYLANFDVNSHLCTIIYLLILLIHFMLNLKGYREKVISYRLEFGK